MSLRKGETIIAGSIADTSSFANNSEVVHLTGAETISGAKTFSSTYVTQSSEAGTSKGFSIEDSSDSTKFVRLQEILTSDGSHYARLLNQSYDKGAYIQIKTYSDGTTEFSQGNLSVAYAPAPTEDTTSSRQIDTVGARNTKINSIIRLKTTYVNGTSGYRIWTDGYCEQWGRGNTSNSTTTITLPKVMANTNYTVVVGCNTSQSYSYANACNIVSTSTIQIRSQGTTEWMWKVSGYLASGQY